MRVFRVLVLVAGLCLASAALAQSDTFTFRAGFVASNGGRAPSGLALGDFNDDGELDAVTANTSPSGGAVTVFIQFDGFFFASDTIRIGPVLNAVVAEDFDGDEIADVLVAVDDGTIAFLKGQGDASFGEPITTPCGLLVEMTCENPTGLASGDFNNDGDLDVAVASPNISSTAPGWVNVLFGNGNGTFTHVKELVAQAGTRAVAAGRLNEDDIIDLAAVNSGAGSLSVFLGQGNGNFQAGTAFPAGTAPLALALGELNGDGALDVVTVDDLSVSVLLGDGPGTFGVPMSLRAGTGPRAVVIGDLDGDGANDVIAVNNGSNDASVLRGDGAGRFAAARSYVADEQPIAVALGPSIAGETLDVWVASLVGFEGSVAALRHRDAGMLNAVEDVPAYLVPSGMAQGDVNNDGLPDLAVTDASGTVLVLNARGDGGFDASATRDIAGGARSPLLIDLTGDGRLDLVVVDDENDRLVIERGVPGGGFRALQSVATAPRPAAVGAGDFNGDGRTDLAVAAKGPPGQVEVFGQAANGTFARLGGAGVDEGPVQLAAAPLNGDGRDDLVVVNGSADTVSILLANAGGSSFVKSQTLQVNDATSIALGRFDRNATVDVAVGSLVCSGTSSLRVFLGDGGGMFTQVGSGFCADSVGSMVARDFTGDQCADLAIADSVDNVVRLHRGACTGSFIQQPISETVVSRMPIATSVGDFDGDGRYDAATANSQQLAQNVSVLINCMGEGICERAGGPPAVRGEANGDERLSAADLIALTTEGTDGDGQAIEDIAGGSYQAERGVDANGDGRVDAQDGFAIARRIFAGG